MSSLQFLNKKSWHVGTKKNEEKVWLREQAANKEAARIAELQKQLNEERKLEDIQRLERASGNSSAPARAPRLDWMYEGPGAAMPGTLDAVNAALTAADKAQEDALLGKTEAALPGVAPVSAITGRSAAGGAAVAAVVDDDSIRQELVMRDAEAKLREDPLLSIKRRHVEELAHASAVHGGAVVRVASRGRPPPVPRASPQLAAQKGDEAQRKAEKQARKEQRARIREERRLRRDGRHGSPSPDGDRSHDGGDEGALNGEREPKRRRSSDSEREEEESNSKRHRDEGDVDAAEILPAGVAPEQYGLCVPAGGTRVAVQTQFMPTPAAGRDTKANPPELPRGAPRRGRPQSAAEREERLATMQADAERLENERAMELRRYRDEEDDALRRSGMGARDEDDVPGFMQRFARDALDKAEHSRRSGASRRSYDREL
jgi:N-terminal domain of CBF1 interacting co-repressor CIR/Pre-mRNA splicing factor